MSVAALLETVRLAGAIALVRTRSGVQMLAFLGLMLLFSTSVLVYLGLSVVFAAALATGYVAVAIAAALRLLRSNGAGFFPSGRVRRATLAGLVCWYVVGATVLLLFWPGLPLVVSAIVAAASAAPVYRIYERDLARVVADRLVRPAALESLQDAQDMVDECRRRLAEPTLQEVERVGVTVNLAHALVARSTLSGSEDGLVEATRLMAPIVETGRGDSHTVFRAADELMTAMAVQAYKHGETRGWRDALKWATEAASRLPDDELLAVQMHFITALAAEPHSARPGEPAHERIGALSRLEDLACTAQDKQVRAFAGLAFASLRGGSGVSDDELDRAITLARQAARGRVPQHWPLNPAVVLAGLLHERATRRGPSAVTDTEEAAALCVRALDKERFVGTVALTLAQVLRLRESLGLGALRHIRHRGRRIDTGGAYRLAFDALARSSDFDPSRVAIAWAEWAIESEDVPEAAEALWCLATVVRTESARRLTRVGREWVLASAQGVAADAGHWLAQAGRLRDAVVAMECGRGILLSGLARHVDPDTPQALAACGRHDLWQRWLDAAARLDALHRSQYVQDGAWDRPPLTPRDLTSAELEAWSAYDHASHAVARALGRRPDALPSYEDLRRASAGTVAVYLGGAHRGGDALIMGLADEPLHVELPDLTAADVEDHTRRFIDARADVAETPERWRLVLGETLRWLAGAVVGPLLPHLAIGTELVLIPTGLLGLLPLHAAPAPEHAGCPDARPAFLVRYAPNVRVDGMARDIAARHEGAVATIAAVSAPHPRDHRPLEWAAAEASGLAHLYGPACTHVPDATKEDTIPVLRRVTIWHLACHGVSRPDRPLDSAILLENGSLTLREMLMWPPGEHRLAVLSACATSVPDPALLDEVVSLPGALLRAGVAGVVASQWRVEDRATALLMLRLHTLLREGAAPSRALAGAQDWLRTATNDRLHRAHPDLTVPPPSLPPSAEAQWRHQVPYRDPQYWAAFCLTGT